MQSAAGAAAAGAGLGRETAAEALCRAGPVGDLVEMARLLDGGAEPDALVSGPDSNGEIFQRTALVVAAECGQLDAVRLLLDRGADPHMANGDGVTPLMVAAGTGYVGDYD